MEVSDQVAKVLAQLEATATRLGKAAIDVASDVTRVDGYAHLLGGIIALVVFIGLGIFGALLIRSAFKLDADCRASHKNALDAWHQRKVEWDAAHQQDRYSTFAEREPKLDTDEFETEQTIRCVIGVICSIIAAISMVLAGRVLFDPWTYVRINQPQLYVAKVIYNRIVER